MNLDTLFKSAPVRESLSRSLTIVTMTTSSSEPAPRGASNSFAIPSSETPTPFKASK